MKSLIIANIEPHLERKLELLEWQMRLTRPQLLEQAIKLLPEPIHIPIKNDPDFQNGGRRK